MLNKNKNMRKWLKIYKTLPVEQSELNNQAMKFLTPLWEENGCFILGIEHDQKANKPFIKSEVNQYQGSYRSPFTQEFYPKKISNYYISPKVTKFERNLNICLQEYAKLLYLNSVSSVYTWEAEKTLTNVFFIQKDVSSFPGVRKGFMRLRMTINSEFKSQNSTPHISTGVEFYNEFLLEVEGKNQNGCVFKASGLMTDNNYKLKEGMDPYSDLIPYIGELFQQIDRKVYLMVKEIVLPLRASSTKKYFVKGEEEGEGKMELKGELFAEIQKGEKDLSKFLFVKRKTKY